MGLGLGLGDKILPLAFDAMGLSIIEAHNPVHFKIQKYKKV